MKTVTSTSRTTPTVTLTAHTVAAEQTTTLELRNVRKVCRCKHNDRSQIIYVRPFCLAQSIQCVNLNLSLQFHHPVQEHYYQQLLRSLELVTFSQDLMLVDFLLSPPTLVLVRFPVVLTHDVSKEVRFMNFVAELVPRNMPK